GDEGDPTLQCGGRRPPGKPLPVKQNFSRVHGVQAKDAADDLAPPCANQSREAENLALVELEADIPIDTGPCKVADFEDHFFPGLVAGVPEQVTYVPAHHVVDDFFLIGFPHAGNGHGPAVTQHHDPVRDLENLLEPVGDVDYRRPGAGDL